MARFRVPSEPSISHAAPADRRISKATLRPVTQQPVIPEQAEHDAIQAQDKGKGRAKDKGKGRARTPPAVDVGNREKLKMAVKQRKVALPRNLRRPDWCHVYVGNLNRSHTQEVLADFFQKNRCGKVLRVVVRTSAGVPASAYSPLPSSPLDRMYASVEFTDVFAIHRALALHGSFLNGVRIAVCLTAVEVPEIQDIIKQHMEGIAHPDDRMNVTKAIQALKRITVERTRVIPVAGPSGAPQAGSSQAPEANSNARRSPRKSKAQPEVAPGARNHLMGVSFARTIV